MNKKNHSIALIADFNIDILGGYLNNDAGINFDILHVPYGHVVSTLLGHTVLSTSQVDTAIIWTRPEAVVQSFQCVIDFKSFSTDQVLTEVDQYTNAILNFKDRARVLLIPTWVLPTYYNGYGFLDFKNDRGIANLLSRMNLRLADNLHQAQDVYILNAQKWIENTGKDSFSPKLWFMGKMPFSAEIFKQAALSIKSAIKIFDGQSKKLVVVDLDDTLWPGLVGNEGWKSLNLGGHDPTAEAFVAFQKALRSLINRGILLAIVSKNDEAIALEAIEKHPEMILRKENFVGWKINWQDKAQNIVDLAAELNLGLQSIVFIDDNPVERSRVREALPDVFVPEWPKDPAYFAQELLALSCFDVPAYSSEDALRTHMYQQERQRQAIKGDGLSMEQWLKDLEIKVVVRELDDVLLIRAAQLLNKTNQMNLSTRRMSQEELIQWANVNGHKLWVFNVSDKFGDSGLTGLISIEIEKDAAKITDFVLSCRIIGRKVEETMIHIVCNYARGLGLKRIYAAYVPTDKNNPCLKFFSEGNFERSENMFSWNLEKNYLLPECIFLEQPN